MPKTLDWYFDFVSPYSYLQAEHLGSLAGELSLRLCPVLFAGVLGHWGHRGPAEIAPKRRFIYRQLLWNARRQGIAFRLPPAHPFNPLRALRLCIALGCTLEAVQGIFRFIYAQGRGIDDPADWDALVDSIGARSAAARIDDREVKDALRAQTEAAIERGVFGVPTSIVDGHLFWGEDSTAMLRSYLEDPTLFDDPEMRRIERLPVGASRR